MTISEVPRERHRATRSLLLITFLIGFPLVLIDIAMGEIRKIQRQNAKSRALQEMDIRLNSLHQWKNPEVFFRFLLQRIVLKVQREKDPLRTLCRLSRAMGKRFPGLFSFSIFNQAGELHETQLPEMGNRLPERLWQWLKEFRSSKASPSFEDKFFKVYLGAERDPQPDLQSGSGFFRTSRRAGKSHFFFHLGQNFSFFTHIHEGAYPLMHAIASLVSRPNARYQGVYLIDQKENTIQGNCLPEDKRILPKIIGNFDRSPQTHFDLDGRLYAVLSLDSRFVLVAAAATPVERQWTEMQRLLRLLSPMFIIFLVGLMSYWLNRTPPPFISLRWKLLVFFLLANGLPLGILSLLGIRYYSERYQGLLLENQEHSRLLLESIDTKLPIIERVCRKSLEDLLSSFSPDRHGPGKRFRRKLARWSKENRCDTILMVGSNSQEIPLVNLPQNERPRNKVLLSLYSEVLQAVNTSDQGKKKNKIAGNLEFISSAMGQDSDEFIDTFVGNLGKIVFQELGPLSGFIYLKTLPATAIIPDYLLGITWGKENMMKNYLERCLSHKPLDDETEVFAMYRFPDWKKSGETGGFRPAYWFFPNPRFSPSLRIAVKQAFFNRHFSSRIVYRGHLPFLFSAFPGNSLRDFLLFSVKPLARIGSEITGIRNKLIVFGLISLGFSVFLAWYLATSFLSPLQRLSMGVKALRENKLFHRIPQLGGDEFGELRNTFNAAMENQYEISTGMRVQQGMFPSAPLRVGAYEVFGVSRTATQMGGDIFDYCQCGKKIFCLHGDSTGHGVPAAMIMATAKAFFFALIHLPDGPKVFLDTFNDFLRKNAATSKRLITLGLLEIDTESHDIRFFNYGNPFPVLLNTTGTANEWRKPGFPLGVRNTLVITEDSKKLFPGERLLFYSDGFFEYYISHQEEPVNEKVIEYLQSRPISPLVEYCHDIMNNHPSSLHDKAPPDDMTLLVVKRNE
jgi:serine phosphatase RsbU (regulator of sigma subunit)